MQAQISDTDLELEGTKVIQLVYWQLEYRTKFGGWGSAASNPPFNQCSYSFLSLSTLHLNMLCSLQLPGIPCDSPPPGYINKRKEKPQDMRQDPPSFTDNLEIWVAGQGTWRCSPK